MRPSSFFARSGKRHAVRPRLPVVADSQQLGWAPVANRPRRGTSGVVPTRIWRSRGAVCLLLSIQDCFLCVASLLTSGTSLMV
jgi:hypothetical protein